MNERFITFDKLLISDEEFPESVEPGMGCLHHPPSVFRWTSASTLLSCHPGCIASGADVLADWFAVVSLIRIQVLLSPARKSNDDRIEYCNKLTDVMSIRPGNDQRQRDATGVHQDVTLASLFSPGLSDSGRLPLGREVL
jgi:hypothetical protein